jgi:heme exporter protein A
MSDGPDSAIAANGLGKRFGARWVLRGVTLDVRRGESVGLLGANGSGKSTVLRVLATLLGPSAGSATVNGLDVVRRAGEVRRQVGYLAHAPGLYDDLTARENLVFAADMLGLPRSAADDALQRTGLARAANDRVRGFSAGMQRRLGLARLVMRRPLVLLLDEPYANLDADGIGIMNDVLGDILRNGGAALLALHELAPSAGMLDRTVTLVEGRIAEPPAEREHAGALSVSAAR